MRYLGIDYGQKRTGLAICDAGEMIASPLKVLTGASELVDCIVRIINREKVEAVVLGLPLNMDGTAGRQAKCVQEFAERIKGHIGVPLHFHDERLSSFEARGKLAGTGLTRKKKKIRMDAVAAASILQSFLDEKHAV
jgi:putative Holliday junction resolvase